LVRERREAAEQHLVDRFRFLVTDFGYTCLGAIPVFTPEVSVRGYVNVAAGRQVEISGHDLGGSLHGLIRQVHDGVPVPYSDRDRWIAFWEIALVRAPSQQEEINHNFAGWEGAVDGSARLLAANPDLLDGSGWIGRRSVLERWTADFKRKFGFVPEGEVTRLADFRKAFAFLVDRGYAITFDTDTLTPHEYGVTPVLRYQRGDDCITIRLGDIRESYWSIGRNHEPIVKIDDMSPETIAAHAAKLARSLRS
jgi:hypothetical protein